MQTQTQSATTTQSAPELHKKRVPPALKSSTPMLRESSLSDESGYEADMIGADLPGLSPLDMVAENLPVSPSDDFRSYADLIRKIAARLGITTSLPSPIVEDVIFEVDLPFDGLGLFNASTNATMQEIDKNIKTSRTLGVASSSYRQYKPRQSYSRQWSRCPYQHKSPDCSWRHSAFTQSKLLSTQRAKSSAIQNQSKGKLSRVPKQNL